MVPNLALPAGTTLDFAEGNDGDVFYNSTGLAATITPVPEPSSLPLCGAAAGGSAALAVAGLASGVDGLTFTVGLPSGH